MQETFEAIINSSNPDSLIENFIVSDLKTYSKYDTFDSQHEVKILTSYYQDVLQYSKTSLCLPPSKIAELLKLANHLVILGTIRKPRLPAEQLKPELDSLRSSFNPSDCESIFSYFSKNYFQNIRLYNFIFSSRENTETAHIKALIDEPLPTVPLSKSVQRAKNRLPIEEPQDLRHSQPSRTKLSNMKKGTESREHLNDANNLDDDDNEVEIADPLVETVNKFHGEIESEFTKHEQVIDQEIEELRKRYR